MFVTSFKIACGATVGFFVGCVLNAFVKSVLIGGCEAAMHAIKKGINTDTEEVTEE